MILAEIEREIKPLSTIDKVRLMRFLADELTRAKEFMQARNSDQAQDVASSQDEELMQYFPPGAKYAVWSAYDEHAVAAELQKMLDEEDIQQLQTS
jgi:hypothetical protein